jgi:hypothetical protein
MPTLFEKLIGERNYSKINSKEIMGDDGPVHLPTRIRSTKYNQDMVDMEPNLMTDPNNIAPEKITRVTYHMTDVFKFNHNTREVTLDTGGYFTVTTKARMNMMSEELNLGFGISQMRGQWYISSNIFPIKLTFTKDWITFNVDTGAEKDFKIE